MVLSRLWGIARQREGRYECLMGFTLLYNLLHFVEITETLICYFNRISYICECVCFIWVTYVYITQRYYLMKFSLLCLGEAAVTVSDDEEIYHIIQEAGVLPHSLRPRVHRRQVARTRMSDRIYRQIQEIRRSRFNRRMIILSDSESSDQSEHDLSDEVNEIYWLLSHGCGLSIIGPLN